MKESSKPDRKAYPAAPKVAVGAVVLKDAHVLLVQRGRPPGQGNWAIPGGSINLGETLRSAAEREVFEETGLNIRAGEPVYTFESIVRDEDGKVRFHYVIIDFAADYIDGEIRPGDDAMDAGWFSVEDLATLPVSKPTLTLLKTRFDFGS